MIGHCVMKVLRNDIQKAAGNLQVYAGQEAGTEAVIHVMEEIFREDECEAVLIVDASNDFNTLNMKAMLHNNSVICPVLSKFLHNTYKETPELILTEGNYIKSQEGTVQEEPIAMTIYALGVCHMQTLKICFEVKPGKEEEARKVFRNTKVSNEEQKHSGAIIGSIEFRNKYSEDMPTRWVEEIKELTNIAKTEPHAAFTNSIFGTKLKWNNAM